MGLCHVGPCFLLYFLNVPYLRFACGQILAGNLGLFLHLPVYKLSKVLAEVGVE